ncbi:MAG: hypothetical protein OXU20_01550 [Myxococcales bacterium]|nr:hypothetical protein [Myxococcales bacterium]
MRSEARLDLLAADSAIFLISAEPSVSMIFDVGRSLTIESRRAACQIDGIV